MKNKRHDRQTCGACEVDKSPLKGLQRAVLTARTLRHHKDAQPIGGHQLTNRSDRLERTAAVVPVNEQVPR